MIQRQQTLWLLLSTIAAILSFMFPFVTGRELVEKTHMERISDVDAGSNFFLLVLTGASLILSSVIIFLFKNRKQQMQLCLAGILLSVLIIILYILQMNKLIKPTLALSCIFPFAIVVGYFMAFRNIRKDEKLVKSLDKLR
jgi:predicted MFS family arabinose efflux permease